MALMTRQMKAAEYRALAQQASILAEGASLENVREKHERSAQMWTQLAETIERPPTPPPS